MNRSELFRNNLHDLLKINKLDRWQIKNSFDLAGRKWFDRVYEHGLDRPNIKTIRYIDQLKTVFGLSKDFNFWQPARAPSEHKDVFVFVNDFLHRFYSCSHTDEWAELAEEMESTFGRWEETVANWLRTKPVTQKTEELIQKTGTESELIAEKPKGVPTTAVVTTVRDYLLEKIPRSSVLLDQSEQWWTEKITEIVTNNPVEFEGDQKLEDNPRFFEYVEKVSRLLAKKH